MNYVIWLIEVKRIIDLRFKGEDTTGFKKWSDWRVSYNSNMTAHEAVTLSGHAK